MSPFSHTTIFLLPLYLACAGCGEDRGTARSAQQPIASPAPRHSTAANHQTGQAVGRTSMPNVTDTIVAVLHDPEWFSNIRGDRYLGIDVTIRNATDQEYWVTRAGQTPMFNHWEEYREDLTSEWKSNPWPGCGDTGPRYPEIKSHSELVFRKIITSQTPPKYLRIRFDLLDEEPDNFPHVAPERIERIEIISNELMLPRDRQRF